MCRALLSVLGVVLLWSLADAAPQTCPAAPGTRQPSACEAPAPRLQAQVQPQGLPAPYVYEPVDVQLPGVFCCTFVNDLNDSDQLVGTYTDRQGIARSFLRRQDGVDLRIERPELLSLFTQGVNNHLEGVAWFRTLTTDLELGEGAIIRRPAIIDPVLIPGAIEVIPTSILDNGAIAGGYLDEQFLGHGFVRLPDGTLEDLDAEGWTIVRGLNSLGHLVGDCPVGIGACRFVNGVSTPIAGPPDAVFLTAEDINTAGQIVGVWFDAGGTQHAYVLTNGVFTDLAVPDAVFTRADGLNDAGVIVGTWVDASGGIHGFVARPAGP